MTYAFTILLMALILWRMIVRELPVAFGLIVPTSAVRRSIFAAHILVLGVVALLLPLTGGLADGLLENYGEGVKMAGVSLVLLSAIVSLLLLEHFDAMPSIALALLGALEGYRVFSQGDALGWNMIGSWLVAPVVAVAIAALLYLFFRKVICRPPVHLIRLSGYMRYVVIVGLALLVLAVGINNGSLLVFAGKVLLGGDSLIGVALAVVMFAGGLLLFGRTLHSRMDVEAERYAEATTQTIVSVCYAVVLTLLLFSSSLVQRVGLAATPLSLLSLILGGFLGVGLVQRSQMPELVRVGRSMAGLVLTPIAAIIIYYLLFSLLTGGESVSEELNITLLLFALMLLMLVFFGRYVRKQERLHEASRKLIQNQQQELFENQKALNAMELNAILAENHSLHGTLELKRKEIINVALGISEQKEFLEMLAEKVHRAAKSSGEEKDKIIAEIEHELGQRTSFSGEIDEFYTQAEVLHKDFSVKLTEEFPNLTTSERRLATLLRLGFSSKYIATLMNISPKSVEISRYRLRQKLGLKKGDNLINFIKSI
ncbi:MAG: hypothetical protein J6K24_01595 [Tidjanibacter sp.]|nr:hypothetical protein [Tidjanibacter sp.]